MKFWKQLRLIASVTVALLVALTGIAAFTLAPSPGTAIEDRSVQTQTPPVTKSSTTTGL
jgi:hypothetical protein